MKCSPENIIYDEVRGETICIETGEVLEDRLIVQGPEWRQFGEVSASRARVGSPLSGRVHDGGLTTWIDLRSRYGRKMNSLNKSIRMRNPQERRLGRVLKEMNRIIGALNIPNSSRLKDMAGDIIKKLFKAKLIKNKNARAFVAVSIKIAARNLGINLDSNRLLNLCRVTKREVWDAEIRLSKTPGINVKVLPQDPRRYLAEMAELVGLTPKTISLAARILEAAKRDGLTSGKAPRGMAAAALYISSILLEEKRTQKEISRKVRVSEVTVRNRYRDLIDNMLIVVRV